MSLIPLSLNGKMAVSVRLVTPWRGVWFADVDLDLGILAALPSGPAVLIIGDVTLKGTIDPIASGTKGAKGLARVVGGQGGWGMGVRAQHFKNDAGVLSTMVYAATGAEVLEVVTDVTPTILGTDFVRAAGPASRVLDGVDWYVNPQTGTTIVGPRIPIPMVPILTEIVDWDPLQQVATVATDLILSPGTVLLDPLKIGVTPVTVRDVEQTFDEHGARAIAWCSTNAVSRLQAAMRTLIREEAGVTRQNVNRYRIVAEGPDGRLTLQIVKKTTGWPDVLPISVWPGMSGDSAKFTPGTECLVEFVAADPTDPVVRSFGAGMPLERTIDATAKVTIGASAPLVNVGTGLSAVALATKVDAIFAAMAAWVPVPTDGGAALKVALTAALVTTPTTASTRLWSD